MRERPIRLKAHEVRAILSGAKSQTRCLFKDLPSWPITQIVQDSGGSGLWLPNGPSLTGRGMASGHWRACPFGKIGDRLWVKETTVRVEEHGYIGPVYVASQEGQDVINWGLAPAPDDCTEVEPYEIKLRPSIHMPRSMCRVVLEITDVRVERLQAISEGDAVAEGAMVWAGEQDTPIRDLNTGDERIAFKALWDSTGGDWDANPWVWVIGFKVIQQQAKPEVQP